MVTSTLPGQLVSTRRFTFGVPDRFTIAAGGRSVVFVRSRSGTDAVGCLWALDVASGAERLLVDPVALLQADGPPKGEGSAGGLEVGGGIGGYALDGAGALAAFCLAGGQWVVELATGRVRRLPATGRVVDPRPDPTGRRIAYVSGGGLRVVEVDASADRQVAAPQGPEVTYGVAEHSGAACLGGARGYWWSPDGAHLLVARVDSSGVDLWHIADPAHPSRPVRSVRYAAAGRANAEVTLWIVSLDGAATPVSWDRGAFEYVPGAGWDEHGPYALVQSRDQDVTRFLDIDPAGGGTTVLTEQRDACWVQLVPGLPARTASGSLVEHSDVGATRRLTVDGAAVTPPGLQVRAVLGVEGDQVLLSASTDPVETHLYTYRAGQGLRQLTTTRGVHTGVCRDGTLVHVTGDDQRIGGWARVLRRGQAPILVDSFVETPVLDVHVEHLVLGPRELRAALYLPSWHAEGNALPVLLDPYGGASAQRVVAEAQWHHLVSQWFAEHGFAVLVVDGSGTPGRGPAWEREVHGDLFTSVLEDQVAALHLAAGDHPDLDLSRVGIRGWSFGASLATAAVLDRPEVFHAAIAGAGVADQLLYNAPWRERFLGHPAQYPERYEAASLVGQAHQLSRPLLLIHGTADDNVHVANTLRLSSALHAANRPHDLMFLPGVGHHAIGTAVTENLLNRQASFLRRHLIGTTDDRPQ